MLITLALIAGAVASFYLFLTWNYDYWKKRNVPGPKPKLFVGNYPNALTQKKHMSCDIEEIYRTFNEREDFVGAYSFRNPQLMILSPTLMRQVLVHDFKHFHDNEISTMIDTNSDKIFGNNPFSLTGEAWKERRALLTPGLTMNRIKTVYPVTNKVCQKMADFIKEQIRIAPKDGMDTKDLCLRFTSELVTDCVLGIQAGSFTKNPMPILGMIKRLFEFSFGLVFYVMTVSLLPSLKKFYKVRFIPKNVEKFFEELMQTAIDMRKAQSGLKDRTDFLNYLLQMQEKKNLTTMDLAANSMTFLLDGYETTAGTLSHCLLCIARYPEVQERLHDEIMQHLDENGSINFETLGEMPYLDACIHETLRLFPPAVMSGRLCTESITLKSKSGVSLNVEPGMGIILPFASIMWDEKYYPNPQVYQPERFFEENGSKVKEYREKGLYYGFSDGPRVCIGMRFALTQMKAALVEILKNFKIKVNSKTREDNVLDPKKFLSELDGGVWLNFKSRL